MLPKKRRIDKGLFKTLGKPSITARSEHITTRVFEGKNIKQSKFAVSISKKIEKSAVMRNHLRRAAYREIKNCLELVKSEIFVHFIFHSKPEEAAQVQNEIRMLIKKISE